MAEETFEVIFLDDDRVTVLDKQIVLAGASCKYQGEPPTKAPTATETYTFVGWLDEEKLESVNEKLVLIAKYTVEVNKPAQDAMLKASLENAESANINETLESGKKIEAQQKALEKDSRSTSEIVNDVMENGKTELGQEQNKDNIEK